MIKELAKLLTEFSVVNHTCCFLHVVNLVAKSLIRQFNIPKKAGDQELSDDDHELYEVAKNVNLEATATAAHDNEQGDDDEGENDNTEGWIDEQDELTAKEHQQLLASTRPFKLALAKVSPQ